MIKGGKKTPGEAPGLQKDKTQTPGAAAGLQKDVTHASGPAPSREVYSSAMVDLLERAQDQLRSMKNQMYPQGSGMLEHLRFKKASLELELRKVTDGLALVNDGIAQLEANQNMEAVLSALCRADII